MDLQDRITNISVRSSVVKEVANDLLLQVHEIAVGSL